VGEQVVLMPCYVNIGAYIDDGSMIDIGAAIGSCAQIGKCVHVSAGAIIGGVLEPVRDSPVIIEDNAFVGANAVVVEGVVVGRNAVIAAGVTITGGSRIIDVTKDIPVEYRGYVPPDSVVVPGSFTKEFPGGKYNVSCALIVAKRTEDTDKKIALNEFLR
jgi:2,3,4,5-tetrahydropyridine-2-carboxylate N-succinyltransferase